MSKNRDRLVKSGVINQDTKLTTDQEKQLDGLTTEEVDSLIATHKVLDDKFKRRGDPIGGMIGHMNPKP